MEMVLTLTDLMSWVEVLTARNSNTCFEWVMGLETGVFR